MENLNESHPELNHTLPRPGGIVRIQSPESRWTKGTQSRMTKMSTTDKTPSQAVKPPAAQTDDVFTHAPGYTCRDYRVKKALDMAPWVLFDENELETSPKPPNPLQDTIDILAVAITTIMLLAAGHDSIPPNHLKWTQSYLENIRDEYGNHPPNVAGILNHLKKTYPDLESFNTQKDPAPEEELPNIPDEKLVTVTDVQSKA